MGKVAIAAMCIAVSLLVGSLASSEHHPKFAVDPNLAEQILADAVENSPPIQKRFSVVKRIYDPVIVERWSSELGGEKIRLPRGSPTDYMVALFDVQARQRTRESQRTRSQADVMAVLVGHDLPADIHSEFPYHRVGFYLFSQSGDLVGEGWRVYRASCFSAGSYDES